MQTRRILALLCSSLYGVGAAGAAMADTVVVDDQVQVRESTVEKPKRGATMTQVEARFGAPATRHDAVGAPPITRWDYPGFSVFFERDRVIDSVTTAANSPSANSG
jgi:hypothetical protein